ncbi:hypothetical protein, variant [Thecamonas trahens ATCC 50062]|uniref:PH domain-containing protein n=1 Tax=Thecamonas trahens ATCC 50062 TaxID=461836 RepID=A0A0L0DRA8_THETB|nr:hypothetical protein, variant [Thecamonas trahens ATCC 50062]KNC54551.1 hypothetical protein, variant [Thecamonas trahens ATCC 50062]|eukprot:XP_013753567.1 hypothetical protein, variant [Thecamonas trahens ATCC 50062]
MATEKSSAYPVGGVLWEYSSGVFSSGWSQRWGAVDASSGSLHLFTAKPRCIRRRVQNGTFWSSSRKKVNLAEVTDLVIDDTKGPCFSLNTGRHKLQLKAQKPEYRAEWIAAISPHLSTPSALESASLIAPPPTPAAVGAPPPAVAPPSFASNAAPPPHHPRPGMAAGVAAGAVVGGSAAYAASAYSPASAATPASAPPPAFSDPPAASTPPPPAFSSPAAASAPPPPAFSAPAVASTACAPGATPWGPPANPAAYRPALY